MSDLVPGGESRPPADPRRVHQLPPDPEPGYPGHPEFTDDTIELREVFRTLRRNVRLVIGLTLLSTGLAAYLVWIQAPEYRAKAVFRLKDERQAMAGGIAAVGMEEMLGRTADPLLSELQVLRSRRVVGEVVDRLGLRLHSLTAGLSVLDLADVYVAADAPPDTLLLRFADDSVEVRGPPAAPATAAYGEPVYAGGVRFTVPRHPGIDEAVLAVTTTSEMADRVSGNLAARAVDRTNVIEVEYTAGHPRLAQLVVNATVEVYREVSVQNALAESTRRRIFIEEQLARTDSALAAAQLELSRFREQEEVFSPREQFAARQAGMLELDVRREELMADARMYRTMLAQLQRAPDDRTLRTLVSSPGVAQNPVIAQLYTQLGHYRASRDSAVAAGRADDNPDVRRFNSLIASTQLQLHDALNSHVLAVEARIGALDTLRMRNAADIRTLPRKEAEEMRLVQLVETARRVADQLREEYQRARIAEAVEAGKVEIVDLAELPVEPIDSRAPLKLALGLMLGLMLGTGAAFAREHMNTAITRNDEIETALRVPNLAVVPHHNMAPISRRRKGKGLRRMLPFFNGRRNDRALVHRPLEELVTVVHGRSPGAEAYRNLRTNLMFARGGAGLKRILVTSPIAAEGKTTTASNLAVTYAQQGLRVLLIDGDLRRSQLHTVFGVPREPGLTELLLGTAKPVEVIHATGVPGLSLLTAGTLPPNPSELLGGPRTRKLLDTLQEGADIIVIDAPPVLSAGDASILGLMSDGVVIVVRAGTTDRAAARTAVRQLQGVGAPIIGAIINDPDAKVERDDGNYYYYAYAYYGEGKEKG